MASLTGSSSVASFRSTQAKVGLTISKRNTQFPCLKCEKTGNDDGSFESVERFPYHSYMDSTSGQLEPASGARASIPGKDYWPEGTAGRVRAANAPEPSGASTGVPSYGKSPGSRRKKYKGPLAASDSSGMSTIGEDMAEAESSNDGSEEPKDLDSDFVVYQTESEEEELTGYELDKKLGRPHPYINPKEKKPIKDPLTSEELWWNWRKSDQQQWSRWQKPRPDVETVFLKAMAETGQVKIYGDIPTKAETSLYRARRHLYKDERIHAEHERLENVGPLAYYSEWVKNWNKDTSREAVQKHFEETGEDENTQLIEMFCHQSDREYRIMMGTDQRISRDPLAMRMREELITQIWGGDPVYPTVNYIQDPDTVIDYRSPDYHEPTPDMLAFLKEHGKVTPREEFEKNLAKEKYEDVEQESDMDEAMAKAVDIGVKDDEGEDSETEANDEEEKLGRKWSVVKSTPELATKAKDSPKKADLSLKEAIDDSENLTDFIMDFEEEE